MRSCVNDINYVLVEDEQKLHSKDENLRYNKYLKYILASWRISLYCSTIVSTFLR